MAVKEGADARNRRASGHHAASMDQRPPQKAPPGTGPGCARSGVGDSGRGGVVRREGPLPFSALVSPRPGSRSSGLGLHVPTSEDLLSLYPAAKGSCDLWTTRERGAFIGRHRAVPVLSRQLERHI